MVNPLIESESAPDELIELVRSNPTPSRIVGKAAGLRVQVAGSYPPRRLTFERRNINAL
jgi:hypothetical protein